MAGGVSLVSGGLAIACSDEKPQPKAIPTARTINDEILALRSQGVVENPAEDAHWQNTVLVPFKPNTVTEAQADALVRPQFGPFVDKMLASTNHYYQEAGTLANSLINQDLLHLNISLQRPDGLDMSTFTYYNQATQRTEYAVTLYTNPLADSDGQSVAVRFAHEMRHVKNDQDLEAAYAAQGIPVHLRADKIMSRVAVQQSCVTEEAAAYALELQAYIYQRALVPSYSDPTYEAGVRLYLTAGNNPDSPQWRELILQNTHCALRARR